jgi:phospholipid/cholesterol/gamma-HCH transport system permease protein
MTASLPFSALFHRSRRRAQKWGANWWRIARFALLMLTLALTPASYRRAHRRAIANQLVLATTVNLAWFCVMAALVSLVLIRIVVVTSQSYGLSKYALDLVVRVLVLELIPLTAALFVALRVTLPDGLEFAQLRVLGTFEALKRDGIDPVRSAFFPRVVAGLFSVWLLAAVSCVTTLVLTYLMLYGFTPWALAGYTRVVGQVFNPAVTTILMLKILFFSFAVALIPMASAHREYDGKSPHQLPRAAHGLIDMVRLFSMILLVEVASLMGNYY